MNNIIVVSREFGSGGREVAKRLSEALGYKYYDKEIISEMLKKSNFDKKYIEGIKQISNDDYPYTISRSFSLYSAHQKQATDVLVLEQKIIKELAKDGNAVFVGRCADIILEEYNPLKMFVYADVDSKINRCIEKNDSKAPLSPKEILKQMKIIDRARKKHCSLLGGDKWGQKENYNICVNTSNMVIKNIIPSLVSFSKAYFGEEK